MKNNIVIIISGPTACGKTSTSLSLAQHLNSKLRIDASIVNFDSLLFYKELNIGTAKPTLEEIKLIEHHLIDIKSISEPINASNYVNLASSVINKLHQDNKTVILVGGSGFYLRALIKGMYDGASTSSKIKERSDNLYQKEGITPFIEFLNKHDPDSAIKLHANDHYRIIRAVEYFWENLKPISLLKVQADKNDPFDFSKNIRPNWQLFHCHLDIPKTSHQEIIEKRTKQMINDGLIDEVKMILKSGLDSSLRPLQSIGYKETIEHLNGDFSSPDEYIERIIISTRQLAKAQRTFFNKIKNKNIYNPLKDKDLIFNDIEKYIRSLN